MDDTTARQLLDSLLANEPPMGPVVSNGLRQGVKLRRRRILGSAATTVLIAVIATVIPLAEQVAGHTHPSTPARTLHSNSQGKPLATRLALPGWTIRVLAGLQVQDFRTSDRVTTDGVRITSFLPDLGASGSGTPPMGWLRSFPATGVAIQIWFSSGGPVGAPPLRDSRFPLSQSSFSRIRPYVGGSEPRPWYCNCYGDGIGFSAAVWIGPRASRARQEEVWEVVGSLRIPALQEGTIWRGTYYVLGRASQYPMGSVTTFAPSSLPGSRSFLGVMSRKGFYLIHAPRAFYVIPRVFQSQPPPTFKVFTCTVAFAPERSQFYCPGTSLRWNRVGQPVGAHAGGGSVWSLGLHIATVAHDGHVLFSPQFGPLLPLVLKGSPWE